MELKALNTYRGALGGVCFVYVNFRGYLFIYLSFINSMQVPSFSSKVSLQFRLSIWLTLDESQNISGQTVQGNLTFAFRRMLDIPML